MPIGGMSQSLFIGYPLGHVVAPFGIFTVYYNAERTSHCYRFDRIITDFLDDFSNVKFDI